MSVVNDIMDRIPNPDGGLRRRFTSGILFTLIVATGIFWFPSFPGIADRLSNLVANTTLVWSDINNPGTLIILFSIIFVIGNLIEVISYVFLGRLFFFAGGTIAYKGLQGTFQSIRRQDNSNAILLSKTEQKTYDELPDYVQEGIRNPYKRQFEVAYRYLIHIAPENEKAWLLRIDARNQNLFSVISSVSLAFLLVFAISAMEDERPNLVTPSALENSKVRQCYVDTLWGMQNIGIIPLDATVKMQSDLISRSPDPIQYMSALLGVSDTDDGLASLAAPPTRGDLSGTADVTRRFLECADLAASERNANATRAAIDVTKKLIVFLALTLAILIPLSVIYAVMLRFSITSALEMLWLRKGIVGRDTDDTGQGNYAASEEVTLGDSSSKLQ